MPRYEFSEGSSHKFWEVERVGATITIRWGRISKNGQTKTKTLLSEDPAPKELEALGKAKLAKGYIVAEAANRVVTKTIDLSLSELKNVAAEHGCCSDEGSAAAIERGNRWGRALLASGFGPLLESEYIYGKISGDAVVRSSDPVCESELADWLNGHVDRMIEETTENLSKSLERQSANG